ncbi:hypothetical protein BH11MYX4_BH11MYX4_20460 [soil metagenome]
MNKSNSPAAMARGTDATKIVDQAKSAVTHVAGDVADRALGKVNEQFESQSEKAVATMSNVASAIRETGAKLKGVGPLADVAGQAADGVDKVAQFFEGKQVGDVFRDVERFARREPAIFIGAAFAVGLIGGRFLKSSTRSHEADAIGVAGAPTQRMPQPQGSGHQGYGQGPRAAIRPLPQRYSAEPSQKASDSAPSSSPLANGVGRGSMGGA